MAFVLHKLRNCTHLYNNLNKIPIVNLTKQNLLHNPHKTIKNSTTFKLIFSTSLLTWLGLSKQDEDKDSELITTIKRSVLSIQRNEYKKAEQLLHIALRLAQQQNNSDGITYVYDLLANLAMEQEQLEKAEKLFVNVLQRLLGSGLYYEDIKVIHISVKLARISQMKKEYEKAQLGYNWCLETIKRHLLIDNKEAQLLNVLIKDWYANYLSEKGDYEECLKELTEAYRIYSELIGKENEKSVLFLNDIGSTNWQIGNLDEAQKCFTEAIVIVNEMKDFEHLPTLYANFGMVKLKQGLVKEAEKYCKEGWRLGKTQNNEDAMKQANYCFDEMNKLKM